MCGGLFRRFSALLLIGALLGNLLAPLAAAASDARGLNAARSDLAVLFGGTIAFCTPGSADEDPGTPPGHGTENCILCCLPQPLRFAGAAVPPVAPFPALAMVTAPWPILSPVARTPDSAPPPYRPRDPPFFE